MNRKSASNQPAVWELMGREGVGEELGEVEGGETIIKIYYMRKMSIFSKRKNGRKKL